ncbi:phage head-tail connector protein [Lactiplantibacillus plantarum]|uniref:phage head-tail connector protein n=1 Tax=Lactiplantibacillus plantarum TaxID=1590 RepID=UPI000FECB44A|nr:phage head-tail connector protein [Lactiplantibacillus plantarum]QAR36919.1 phage head-tail connector protein [Lactiplantibacillus plantarum]RWZ07093.1 phage head-tail connector protein [Lactiplantibacillus plantarum]RWZ34932.1 phage head-tail connector protein [Lactiplantibacillus plantarum]
MSDVQDSDKTLENVITLLGIEPTDDEKDRLTLYIDHAEQAIILYLGRAIRVQSLPAGLDYIVENLAVTKFNKFHNEGEKSHTEEGLSFQFNVNDLAPYYPDLQAWIDGQSNTTRGATAIGW